MSFGGGMRKVRFTRSGGGKSSGYRVIYVFAPEVDMPVFPITVFAENEKAVSSAKAPTGIRTVPVSPQAGARDDAPPATD